MSASEIVYLLLSFTFGGGLVALVRAFGDNRKASADAEAIAQKTGPEVAEITASTLGEVIQNLRDDNDTLRQERDYYRQRLTEVNETVDHLRGELNKLQAEIQALLAERPH